MIEVVACGLNDMNDGEMKEVQAGEKKFLLSKVQGQYYATSALCTHYKAQLVKGTLTNEGRVMCPWHGACFNVKTADIEDAPALDSLVKFEVQIRGNDVVVLVDEEKLAEGKRSPNHSCKEGEDQRVFAIVGGGASAMVAIQTLREEGFKGKIIMISQENNLPFDRIKLTKVLKTDATKLLLRTPEYFTQAGVESILGVSVVSLDKSSNTIKLSNGKEIKYDSILLCTGGTPRMPWPESKNLKNVFPLRSADDANKLDQEMERKEKPNVVIVGSGFIGMELAAILVKNCSSLTVIGSDQVPFQKILGDEVGKMFKDLFESKDVKFKFGNRVEKLESADGERCNCVVLKGGEKIECDIVVVGAGVVPSTQFLNGSIDLEKDQSVAVDTFLKVKGTSNIFAAGDIATFPYKGKKGEEKMVRIEHWNMAEQQGRIAAKNMLGKNQSFNVIPYFWTNVFGKGFRYTGHPHSSFDQVFIEGKIEEHSFIIYYINGDEVVGVGSMGKDPAVSTASEAFRLSIMPKASFFKNGSSILNLKLGN